MKKIYLIILILLFSTSAWSADHDLTEALGETITEATFGGVAGGDTITINVDRHIGIRFDGIVGTSGSWITIRNPSNAQNTITGTTTNWDSNIVLEDCRYVKIEGDKYSSETYGIKLSNSTGMGIRAIRSKDWAVSYVEIANPAANGIAQNYNNPWTESDGPIQNVSIHHNYIHDTGIEGMYLGKTDVGDWPKFEDIQIYSNIVDNCGWDCLQLEQTAGSDNNIYENIVSDCGTAEEEFQSWGIIVQYEASGVEIYQNSVARVWKSGIQLGSVRGVVSVHDNVVWNAGEGGTYDGIFVLNTPTEYSHTIINNTVVSSTGYGIKTPDSDTLGTARYNLLVANVSGGIDSNYSTQNDNRTATSTSTEYFTDAGSGDFHLTDASPANDAGVGAGYSTTDFDGNTRPYTATNPDIGAYEYQGVTPPQGSGVARRLVGGGPNKLIGGGPNKIIGY